MSVDDIDGEGTHIDELTPDRLGAYLMQSAADLEKRARELVHAHTAGKHEAAQRLTEKATEYVALCDRHAMVRWDDWKRVEKLRQLAKSLRELGDDAEANRYEAQAEGLSAHCFEGSTP